MIAAAQGAPETGAPEPAAARALRKTRAVDPPPPSSLAEFRAVLRALTAPALAALLRELGHALYEREIRRWRVLTDVSDELLDQATAPARRRLVARFVGAGVVGSPDVEARNREGVNTNQLKSSCVKLDGGCAADQRLIRDIMLSFLVLVYLKPGQQERLR